MLVSPDLLETIDDLAEHLDAASRSEVVRRAVQLLDWAASEAGPGVPPECALSDEREGRDG